MIAQPTILQDIFAQKKKRVEEAKHGFEYGEFVARARRFRRDETPNRFRSAFDDSAKINIIAEIKRASPSIGTINNNLYVDKLAPVYQQNGACAISVLTEEDHFKGNVEDLMTARNLTDLPILRKDFIFDEFQIYEAALIGADAILLIVAMLDDENLLKLYSLASGLGLDVLVGTHNLEELIRAAELGANIIGVNNRNLHSFEVSLETSRELAKFAPEESILIAEGGLKTKQDLVELKELGFNGFLIGESLMTAENTGEFLRSLHE